MTSALPQVCRLLLVLCKGMLPVRHQAPIILKVVAVNYCVRQLAKWLGWAAHAYPKKKSATQHPGMCKHSLQYDWRPDGHFGVRVGRWNLGSLSGNGVEVCEELIKRMIDMCCLQELRWGGQGARMLGDERRKV